MKKLKILLMVFVAVLVISLLIPSTLFADSGSNVEAFVTRFYQQCLGRGPDPEGLQNWVGHLNSGHLAGADVAQRFIFSEEFEAKGTSNQEFLHVMYRAFFNRPPDPEGYAGWLGQLESGRSRNFVLAGFVNSVEFERLCAAYGINTGSIDGGSGPSSSAPPAAPSTVTAAGTINVVCMGDSLIGRSDWVARLERLLRANYPGVNFNVIPSAVNGEMAQGGYSRFHSTVAVHNPHIIVIAYGTNDASNGLSRYDRYLSALTKEAKSTGAIVFLNNFGPIDTRAFPSKSDYMDYVARVPSIASKYGAIMIDVHGPLNANRSANFVDWCHYSAQGSEVVAQTVFHHLDRVLVR